MGIIRWDPFRDFSTLQEEMNRLFEEAHPGWQKGGASPTTEWRPAVDIYETAGEIVVKAEIPGVDRKDIELSLQDNVLTLKGERQFEKETEGENYHRIERSYGRFSRSFSVPAIVDAKKIQADYQEGVLTITLPKTEKARPKQIKISN